MDYSLLVGIHDCDQAETEQQNDSFENDEDEEGGPGEEEDSPGSGGDAGAGEAVSPATPLPPIALSSTSVPRCFPASWIRRWSFLRSSPAIVSGFYLVLFFKRI